MVSPQVACLDELCAKLEDGHPLIDLVESHPQFSEALIRYQRESVRHNDLWRLLEEQADTGATA